MWIRKALIEKSSYLRLVLVISLSRLWWKIDSHNLISLVSPIVILILYLCVFIYFCILLCFLLLIMLTWFGKIKLDTGLKTGSTLSHLDLLQLPTGPCAPPRSAGRHNNTLKRTPNPTQYCRFYGEQQRLQFTSEFLKVSSVCLRRLHFGSFTVLVLAVNL